MAGRWDPGPHPRRASALVHERAGMVREWMEAEVAEGRACGEDEVWERVTGQWPDIGTQMAEFVLAEAMRDVPYAGPSR